MKDDPALLDEVTRPRRMAGGADGRASIRNFMDLPPEVLTTSMRTHQKYFACLDRDGRLAPRFLLVANMDRRATAATAIVAGNERVLRARLSDARFFWDQDRKTPLVARVPKLAERVFHAKLGSVLDKVAAHGCGSSTAIAARHVPGADADKRPRAPRSSPRPICRAAWSASSPSCRA